jgi:hypothetical protein
MLGNAFSAGGDISVLYPNPDVSNSTMQMAHRLLQAIIGQPHMSDFEATFNSGLTAGAIESGSEEQVTGNSMDDSEAFPYERSGTHVSRH